jgi:cytochrome c556
MKFSKLAALSVVGLLTLGVASVFADTPLSADDAVSQRQAAMKQDGKALRGAMDLTGDKAVAVLATVEANYTKLPSLFPKDSITGNSSALPLIWTDFDKFSAIFKKGADAAADGIAAAKGGDTAKYQADLKVIFGTCDECHSTYRSKDH